MENVADNSATDVLPILKIMYDIPQLIGYCLLTLSAFIIILAVGPLYIFRKVFWLFFSHLCISCWLHFWNLTLASGSPGFLLDTKFFRKLKEVISRVYAIKIPFIGVKIGLAIQGVLTLFWIYFCVFYLP